jgi:hypothetical protein
MNRQTVEPAFEALSRNHLLTALLAVCLAAPAAPAVRAETPAPAPAVPAASAPRPVAVVLAQPIQEAEIEPAPAEAARQQAALDAEAFARWQLQARAKKLAGLVQVRLLDAYAKQHRLEPTEAELKPLLASLAATSRQTEEAMKKTRERRTAEIRAKLAAPDLAPADRERLQADLAQWEKFPSRPGTDDRAFMSNVAQYWKVQRSLYKRYGGRVLVSAFGAQAIDGQQTYLREEEKRGSFEIFDPGLRAAFWAASADETWADGAIQGRDADEVFATPPWQDQNPAKRRP